MKSQKPERMLDKMTSLAAFCASEVDQPVVVAWKMEFECEAQTQRGMSGHFGPLW